VKTGDRVRLKPGVKDLDFGNDLGGWQGRVTGISGDGGAEVAWDSLAPLYKMPAAMIAACVERGMQWEVYVSDADDFEPPQPRDTPVDVQKGIAELTRRHVWDWLGPEGELVRQVFTGLDAGDEGALIGTWEAHMQAHLSFPFDAAVDEAHEHGPLRAGDRVRVHSILDADEFYGITAGLRRGRKRYACPLCDLAALGEDSENRRITQAYRVWFANR
jgi:hypothetical protein